MITADGIRAAREALIYHGGDPGPRGGFAIAMALDAAKRAEAGESRDVQAQAAIAEARRRTKLRLSVGRRLR